MTLRESARQLIIDSVSEAASLDHGRNYSKLHVRRNGQVTWSECINQSDDLIDSQAESFRAIESVACVGTGPYVCNCNYCDEVYSATDEERAKEDGREYDIESKYATQADAIADAVCDSDLSDLEADMLAKFTAIPVGYFADEVSA